MIKISSGIFIKQADVKSELLSRFVKLHPETGAFQGLTGLGKGFLAATAVPAAWMVAQTPGYMLGRSGAVGDPGEAGHFTAAAGRDQSYPSLALKSLIPGYLGYHLGRKGHAHGQLELSALEGERRQSASPQV
jgi:hypothetical protein